MQVVKKNFGTTQDGYAVDLYTLTNANGMEAKIITYGGIIVSLKVPDKNGRFADVVLGFDTLKDYEEKKFYFGCITGRYANRIANGKFTLDGVEYNRLATNNGPNHLHGGIKGFDKVIWKAEVVKGGLQLHYLSKDMEEGYPGNLDVMVTYILTDDNELKIDYEAATDKPTVCNLTNHSYFNLAGHGAGTQAMVVHPMMINADGFIPLRDKGGIPTGEIRAVKGTPMDFTTAKPIGLHIDDKDEQIRLGGGFDHSWVLNKRTTGELSLAAWTWEPTSGRRLEIYTTEPGVQFYTGNYLNGTAGKEGKPYPWRSGFCLETQHYPDSPNQSNFPSTVLRPGEKYQSTTIHKFAIV